MLEIDIALLCIAVNTTNPDVIGKMRDTAILSCLHCDAAYTRGAAVLPNYIGVRLAVGLVPPREDQWTSTAGLRVQPCSRPKSSRWPPSNPSGWMIQSKGLWGSVAK